jgi:hypothetical protein
MSARLVTLLYDTHAFEPGPEIDPHMVDDIIGGRCPELSSSAAM